MALKAPPARRTPATCHPLCLCLFLPAHLSQLVSNNGLWMKRLLCTCGETQTRAFVLGERGWRRCWRCPRVLPAQVASTRPFVLTCPARFCCRCYHDTSACWGRVFPVSICGCSNRERGWPRLDRISHLYFTDPTWNAPLPSCGQQAATQAICVCRCRNHGYFHRTQGLQLIPQNIIFNHYFDN